MSNKTTSLTMQALTKIFEWQLSHPIIPEKEIIEDLRAIIKEIDLIEDVPVYKYFTKIGHNFKLKYTSDLDKTFEYLSKKSIKSYDYNFGIPVFVLYM